MGQLIWGFIQLCILPFKIFFTILEFIGHAILDPLFNITEDGNAVKLIFVLFCIFGTLVILLRAME